MIEVNNEFYEKRQENPAKKPAMSGKVLGIMTAAMAMTGGALPGLGSLGKSSFGYEWSDEEIVEEYKLIQQKKSSLSRSERSDIEYFFNRRFVKVDIDNLPDAS